MRTLIQMALDSINPAKYEPIVLLQLTQPLRSLNLIDNALQVYNACPARAVMSYVLGPECWRVLSPDGNYNADLRPTGQRLRVHDGSIYIFNSETYPQLWNNAPKSSVQNEVDELIDIDYQDQFDPQKLKELCKFYT